VLTEFYSQHQKSRVVQQRSRKEGETRGLCWSCGSKENSEQFERKQLVQGGLQLPTLKEATRGVRPGRQKSRVDWFVSKPRERAVNYDAQTRAPSSFQRHPQMKRTLKARKHRLREKQAKSRFQQNTLLSTSLGRHYTPMFPEIAPKAV